MDVKANAVVRRTQRELQSDGNFMSASARGREPKATLTAISGYLNGLGVEFVSMNCRKDVDGITAGDCWS